MKTVFKGRVAYSDMLAEQQQWFDSMVGRRQKGEDTGDECLFLVEHDPVFTLGRHGKEQNLLINEDRLRAQGIEVHRIGRGGDITFHGPGQLVAYPILDLQRRGLGIRDYIDRLEETIIRTIGHYEIVGQRVTGATGVWIDKDTPVERKICAIGVKSSRMITMHGLALNVNTDLKYFRMINPCGFIDKGVTSITRELQMQGTDKIPTLEEVAKVFESYFLEVFS